MPAGGASDGTLTGVLLRIWHEVSGGRLALFTPGLQICPMKLFCQERGEGFPVLILHGLFGMGDNWASIAAQLADSHRVVMPDLRNHGRSPHDEAMTLDLMTEDVLDLMEDQLLEKPVVMGHSMGGKVAMNLALKFPSLVHALIVADIGPRAYPPHHDHILDALDSVPLSDISRRQDAEEILARRGLPPDIRQFLLKSLARDEQSRFYWRFNLAAIRKNLSEVGRALPGNLQFKGPALFIKGEKSNYITDEDGALIAALFPQAALSVIPRAGHWVHAENFDAFLAVVRRFLAGV